MRRRRKVKIIATLGPASSSQERVRALFEAGADVFRINMSHTGHPKLLELVTTIRAVEKECARPIGILVDLQGPKLRIGEVAGGEVEIRPDDRITFDGDKQPGDGKRFPLPHPEILTALEPGHTLLVDDGKLRLTVEEADGTMATARVVIGGVLKSRKGVSLPDTTIAVSAMTPKDRSDLDYALTLDIDWVALSFVQRPADMAELRRIARGRVAVMAKIEKPQALTHIAEILEYSDGLMVARGDLGVELPLESVPGIQKDLTRASRRAGKPVVVATQMLESMIQSPQPTRAEVSDVATAVYEGADAVMLSAESASGAWPVEAVATMSRIAERVERDPHYPAIINAQRSEPEETAADAISVAARSVAETLRIPAIICWTSSGATGLRIARERPLTPIVALTPKPSTARRLALAWGLHCVLTKDVQDQDDMVDRACSLALRDAFVETGQRVIIVAGVPFRTPGATNMLRIAFVGHGAQGTGPLAGSRGARPEPVRGLKSPAPRPRSRASRQPSSRSRSAGG